MYISVCSVQIHLYVRMMFFHQARGEHAMMISEPPRFPINFFGRPSRIVWTGTKPHMSLYVFTIGPNEGQIVSRLEVGSLLHN